jgi:UDP:flavonoid glycosyltransferase YjiC (YdhE family)
MRILFTFTGGVGHFLPTTVFARALVRQGHEIRYGCQESMVAKVEAAGWWASPTGGTSLLATEARRPLAPIDRVAEEQTMGGFFAGKAARERARRLGGLIETWRPQMVIRDEVDFGAALAADVAGLPHAAIVVIAAGRLTRPEIIEAPLAGLRTELGLDPERAVEALHRYLLLIPVPPGFRDPQVPLPATARHVRPAILEEVDGPALPAPRRGGGARRPQVYFTLGTVFPQESGDLFQRVLAGLTRVPVEVTVTIGDALQPGELGRQPPSVRVQRYLPQGEALAASDLVVSHGGSGTVVSSLALGRPQVLLPMGADQPDNADRCRELGVGLDLDPLTTSPDDIADAVGLVLSDPGYRTAAHRMSDEARLLPDADHAASLLEAIGRSGEPIGPDVEGGA